MTGVKGRGWGHKPDPELSRASTDGMSALMAAIICQAVEDVRQKKDASKRCDAAAWLFLDAPGWAPMLDPDLEVDPGTWHKMVLQNFPGFTKKPRIYKTRRKE